jgi:hypothetical protein
MTPRAHKDKESIVTIDDHTNQGNYVFCACHQNKDTFFRLGKMYYTTNISFRMASQFHDNSTNRFAHQPLN